VILTPDLHAGLLLDGVTPELAQVALNRLLSNRAAEIGDILPETSKPATAADDRGGWWADPTFGSRFWLLRRAKLIEETLARAVTYAEEALKPMVDIGMLGSVSAESDFVLDGTRRVGVSVDITVTAPDGAVGSIRFANLWQQLGD